MASLAVFLPNEPCKKLTHIKKASSCPSPDPAHGRSLLSWNMSNRPPIPSREDAVSSFSPGWVCIESPLGTDRGPCAGDGTSPCPQRAVSSTTGHRHRSQSWLGGGWGWGGVRGRLTRLQPGDSAQGQGLCGDPVQSSRAGLLDWPGCRTHQESRPPRPQPYTGMSRPSVRTASLGVPSPDSMLHQERPIREKQITAPGPKLVSGIRPPASSL